MKKKNHTLSGGNKGKRDNDGWGIKRKRVLSTERRGMVGVQLGEGIRQIALVDKLAHRS